MESVDPVLLALHEILNRAFLDDSKGEGVLTVSTQRRMNVVVLGGTTGYLNVSTPTPNDVVRTPYVESSRRNVLNRIDARNVSHG